MSAVPSTGETGVVWKGGSPVPSYFNLMNAPIVFRVDISSIGAKASSPGPGASTAIRRKHVKPNRVNLGSRARRGALVMPRVEGLEDPNERVMAESGATLGPAREVG